MNARSLFWILITGLGFLGALFTYAQQVSAQEAPAPESPAPESPNKFDYVNLTFPTPTPGPKITLKQALNLAESRNLSLAAVRTEIESAQAQLYSSWSLLLPQVSANLSHTHWDHEDTTNMQSGGQSITIVTQKQDDIRGALQVSMPLVNAQAWLGIGVGDIAVNVAELTVETSHQAVLLTVSQAYFQALTARALIDIQQNQIRSSQRHLAVASFRHRSGTGSRLDVIRARMEILAAYEELLIAHTSYDNTRELLASLTASQELPQPQDVTTLRPPHESEEMMISQTLQQREDLKLKQTLIDLADEQLTLSWMRFLPTLSALWQLNYQFTEPGGFRSLDKSRWYIGLTLTVPIYDHTRYPELDAKRAAIKKAQFNLQDAEITARHEVRRAHRSYQNTLAQIDTASKKVDLGRESLTLAESAYESGLGSSLDVTDTRRTYRAAEINLATKRFAMQLALLELLRKMGTDFSTLGE